MYFENVSLCMDYNGTRHNIGLQFTSQHRNKKQEVPDTIYKAYFPTA